MFSFGCIQFIVHATYCLKKRDHQKQQAGDFVLLTGFVAASSGAKEFTLK